MESSEFSKIRQFLGKSQSQLARLLCTSPKAIQSFEQGWRNIPPGVERQLLFLLSQKGGLDQNASPCWDVKSCPVEWRENCTAWEMKAGYYCWFINGTFCNGEFQGDWERKIELCKQCEVFRLRMPTVEEQGCKGTLFGC